LAGRLLRPAEFAAPARWASGGRNVPQRLAAIIGTRPKWARRRPFVVIREVASAPGRGGRYVLRGSAGNV
jgi:hypothetical protein